MNTPAEHPALPPGHAGKPREIEEVTDAYFTRPVGAVITTAAAALRLTPTQVTIAAMIAGAIGGALLYDQRFGLLAFAFLFLHAIFDSADGQLARRTGQATELGRVLDGLAGYVTHIAIYVAVAAGHIDRGGSYSILIWMVLAGISTIVQAQAYDYYRTAYAAVVNEGRARTSERADVAGWLRGPYQAYSALQRLIVASHEDVGATLNARAGGGAISESERQRYRVAFRPLVRGWNLFGDNTRRYAIGVLVCFGRIELLFVFIAIVMNVVFIVIRTTQARADRRFLSGL